MSPASTCYVAVVAIFAICYPGLIGATTYTVGDSAGWAIPADTSYYQTWAANKTFVVGDTLYFNWMAIHNVANVTEAEYEGCTKVNSVVGSSSPVKIELTTSGPHYYICTVGPHCSLGQKLGINVSESTTNSTTPAATTPSAASSTTFSFFSYSVLLLVLFG